MDGLAAMWANFGYAVLGVTFYAPFIAIGMWINEVWEDGDD